MLRFSVFCALVSGLGGCKPDCQPGPDIQVTVVAEPGLSVKSVAFLYVYMSVDGGPMRAYPISLQRELGASNAFLLHPDTAVPQKYNLALQIDALDVRGNVVAFGTAAGPVTTNGCNRLEALLTTLPGGGNGDMGTDGFIAPDLSNNMLPMCQVQQAPESVDEDQDGRANTCDLCPADADNNPVDTDGDGVPDACDPDPSKVGNRTLYFAPFNQDDGYWSGGYQINQSFMATDAMGPQIVYSSNAADALQANVRVQTVAFVGDTYYNGAPAADVGIYLGSSATPSAAGTSGMVCLIHYAVQGGPDTLDLVQITNGVSGVPTSTQSSFGNRVRYRLRLTQRGNMYTCEAFTQGFSTVTTTAMGPAPTTTQYMALRNNALVQVNFHSVVAESVVP